MNVYLNDEDIRYLDRKENAPVSESDSLSIIPSIAGGAPVAEAANPGRHIDAGGNGPLLTPSDPAGGRRERAS